MVARLHGTASRSCSTWSTTTRRSDEHGPTLSLARPGQRQLLPPAARRAPAYENHTGCGNTLDLRQPRVLQMVLDSLRYWAGEMHVDGFRFDLAPVLGRGDHGFDATRGLLHALAQDPLLAGLKMIAEPWDVGPGGYQLGASRRLAEWNDRFRDTCARSGSRADGTRGEFAQRLMGSSDLFPRQRAPGESVNFVVAHDGFTLADLVRYAAHNEANGETTATATATTTRPTSA